MDGVDERSQLLVVMSRKPRHERESRRYQDHVIIIAFSIDPVVNNFTLNFKYK